MAALCNIVLCLLGKKNLKKKKINAAFLVKHQFVHAHRWLMWFAVMMESTSSLLAGQIVLSTCGISISGQ